ncbi:hypothetical protein JTB14_006635 [Gonioctena quinquepunctata]|nr:hypothetical protein JTB14_006635 [Gonioctena quinquepunctata]
MKELLITPDRLLAADCQLQVEGYTQLMLLFAGPFSNSLPPEAGNLLTEADADMVGAHWGFEWNVEENHSKTVTRSKLMEIDVVFRNRPVGLDIEMYGFVWVLSEVFICKILQSDILLF